MNSKQRDGKIRDIAFESVRHHNVEIDDDAVIREDHRGCFVQTWVKVEFTGTELDKKT